MSATQLGGRLCLPRFQPKQKHEHMVASARPRKPPGHGARAVLDKFPDVRSSESSTRGTDRNPTSAVLDEVFTSSLQIYPQEAEGASIADVDEVSAEVEDELSKVFQALRVKEEELAQQEQDLVKSRRALQDTKKELSERAMALAEAVLAQVAREKEAEDVKARIETEAYEMEAVRRKLESRLADMARSKKELEEKAQHLQWAQDALFEKTERARQAQEGIEAMDKELVAAGKELEAERASLREAEEARRQGEEEARLLKRELFAKEQQLGAAIKELQKKERMLQNMGSELLFLQEQSAQEAEQNSVLGSDLSGVQKLLKAVQAELQASRRAVARSQSELSRMHADMARKEGQLADSAVVLQRRETQLGFAAKDLDQVRAALKAERLRCEDLQSEVEEEVERGRPILHELAELRASFRATVQEVVDLKLELREKERVLSDTKLALQMKEAEVAAMKVELKDLEEDLSLAEREVGVKGQSVIEAQKLIAGLRRELVMVESEVQMREERARAMQEEMSRKEGALGSLRTELTSTQAKALDTESAMRQITELSKNLAEAAGARNGQIPRDPHDAECQEALADTSQKLFTTSRRLVERGLQLAALEDLTSKDDQALQVLREQLTAVKAQLVEREEELQDLLSRMVEKEKAMQGIESSWQVQGAQVARERDQVAGGAHELLIWKERLDEAIDAGGLAAVVEDGSFQDPSLVVAKFELQVVREEVSAAVTALQDLADLSMRLKEEALEKPVPSLSAKPSNKSQSLDPTGAGLSLKEGRSYAEASGSHSGSVDAALVPAQPVSTEGADAKVEAAELDGNAALLVELQEELESRDAALLLASQAVMGLSSLSKQLATEASPEK